MKMDQDLLKNGKRTATQMIESQGIRNLCDSGLAEMFFKLDRKLNSDWLGNYIVTILPAY